MKCVIFTQRVEVVAGYNERRDCADQRIVDFIYACGFLPMPVPNRKELTNALLNEIKPAGIILTGGNSLVKYGGSAPERDEMDRALLQVAIQEGIPIYGFCRGMQSILDFFGNTLLEVEGHVAVRHWIHGLQGSFEVNSYHAQGCIELCGNSGLEVAAQADDGVIEEVYHKFFPIVATMWHPERENTFAKRDVDRLKKLFTKTE